MNSDSSVEIKLERIVYREKDDRQWVLLKEKDGQRSFAIVIATQEMLEIARVVHNEDAPRPLTHQLALSIAEGLGARLERIVIVDLRENTYFAELVLVDAEETEHRIDARPSDALALAMRAGCPIEVVESVLEQARSDSAGPDPLPE